MVLGVTGADARRAATGVGLRNGRVGTNGLVHLSTGGNLRRGAVSGPAGVCPMRGCMAARGGNTAMRVPTDSLGVVELGWGSRMRELGWRADCVRNVDPKCARCVSAFFR